MRYALAGVALLLTTLSFSQQQALPPPASPPYTTPPTFPEAPQMPPDRAIEKLWTRSRFGNKPEPLNPVCCVPSDSAQ